MITPKPEAQYNFAQQLHTLPAWGIDKQKE